MFVRPYSNSKLCIPNKSIYDQQIPMANGESIRKVIFCFFLQFL